MCGTDATSVVCCWFQRIGVRGVDRVPGRGARRGSAVREERNSRPPTSALVNPSATITSTSIPPCTAWSSGSRRCCSGRRGLSTEDSKTTTLAGFGGAYGGLFTPTGPPTARAATPGTGPATGAPDTSESGSSSPAGLDLVHTELGELRAQVTELTGLRNQLAVLTDHLGPTSIQPTAATATTTGRTDDP